MPLDPNRTHVKDALRNIDSSGRVGETNLPVSQPLDARQPGPEPLPPLGQSMATIPHAKMETVERQPLAILPVETEPVTNLAPTIPEVAPPTPELVAQSLPSAPATEAFSPPTAGLEAPIATENINRMPENSALPEQVPAPQSSLDSVPVLAQSADGSPSAYSTTSETSTTTTDPADANFANATRQEMDRLVKGQG